MDELLCNGVVCVFMFSAVLACLTVPLSHYLASFALPLSWVGGLMVYWNLTIVLEVTPDALTIIMVGLFMTLSSTLVFTHNCFLDRVRDEDSYNER